MEIEVIKTLLPTSWPFVKTVYKFVKETNQQHLYTLILLLYWISPNPWKMADAVDLSEYVL